LGGNEGSDTLEGIPADVREFDICLEGSRVQADVA
jgi:hypothetical protein